MVRLYYPTLVRPLFLFLNLLGTKIFLILLDISSYLTLKADSNAKVLLALKGNQDAWEYVSGSSENRLRFALECLFVCKFYGFDGIDTDWEFPKTPDRDNLTMMHKEIFDILDPLGFRVSAAISAGNYQINVKQIYDFPELSKYVHAFNLMTYDIHMDQKWDIASGVNFNAPKAALNGESMESGIKLCLSKGAPASKLFVGLPFYSRTYKLVNAALNTVGSPFIVGLQKNKTNHFVQAYSTVMTIQILVIIL